MLDNSTRIMSETRNRVSQVATLAAALLVTRVLVNAPLPLAAPYAHAEGSPCVFVSLSERAQLDRDTGSEVEALERFVECEENDDDDDRMRSRLRAGQHLWSPLCAQGKGSTCALTDEELLDRAPKTSPPLHS